MKRIIVFRHAKSSWKDGTLSDHQRPLNTRGKTDAQRMGETFRSLDLNPEVIICSTAVRAKRTAEIVAEFSGFEEEIIFDEFLYHADIDQYLESISGFSRDYRTIMIVGHNPGIESLVEFLVGDYYRMPTCAAAVIDIDIAKWRELLDMDDEGNLANLIRPKEMWGRY